MKKNSPLSLLRQGPVTPPGNRLGCEKTRLVVGGSNFWSREFRSALEWFPMSRPGNLFALPERFALSAEREAFHIVVTADRIEAHRHIGGPSRNGGVRSSIATPHGRKIIRPTSRARSSLQTIPAGGVSQRSATAFHYHPKD